MAVALMSGDPALARAAEDARLLDLALDALPAERPHPRRLAPEAVGGALARGTPFSREGPDPRYRVGERVMTRLPARNGLVPGGHTRLPAYAAGHVGVILAFHGCHVLPDASAHKRGEEPEPLYTVGFDAADLWGAEGAKGDEVTLDLWESYLHPAPLGGGR